MNIHQILNDPLQLVLVSAFLLMVLIQLVYFWFFFSRLAFLKQQSHAGAGQPPVSVVLTASNQYEALSKNLPLLFEQDYPDFEVVVVNDNSDDDTDELLKTFAGKFPALRVVELTQSLNWFRGRKFPLSLGIKSAAHQLLLLTDANCTPEGPQWLQQMTSAFEGHTEMVLGYATCRTGSHINSWLRFTAFYDAIFFLSAALAGIPFKGSGRNLSYKKALFYSHKGFSSHYTINAGDDELFVNKAATRRNVSVKVGSGAQVAFTKSSGFGTWLKSEKTRLQIRRYFKFRHRLLLHVFNLSNFLVYALLLFLLISGIQPLLVAGAFALRLLSQLLIFGLAQKRLTEKKLLLLSPVYEIFLILIDLCLWLMLIFTRKNKWT